MECLGRVDESVGGPWEGTPEREVGSRETTSREDRVRWTRGRSHLPVCRRIVVVVRPTSPPQTEIVGEVTVSRGGDGGGVGYVRTLRV